MFRSIRTKIMLGFSLIFAVLMLLLNIVIGHYLDNSNKTAIENELNTLMNNSNVFVRQVFLINNYNNERENFERVAVSAIIPSLKSAPRTEVAAYTIDGEYLGSTSENYINAASDYDDLNKAVNRLTAYTIIKQDNEMQVYFSYPVDLAGEEVGIIRFYKDYSSIYEQSQQIVQFTMFATIGVFIAAVVFSLILSTSITNPITKLTRATTQVSKGNMVVMRENKRQDEIGKMMRNFNLMVRRIERQINIIRKDRDALRVINQYRKDFYDNVTHELKTPLTTILGYAEILNENGFTDYEFFRKGIQHIIDESQRLNGMVIDLLEFSKASSKGEEPMGEADISDIVHNTIEEMNLKARRYKCFIRGNLMPRVIVQCRANEVKQVVINLLDNAIKYSPRDSSIVVMLRETKTEVILTIQNPGSIDSNNLDRIFIPFYRADKKKSREEGSSGLGLAIVKKIIDEHGGTIEIDSKDNLVVSKVVLLKEPGVSYEG